METSPAIEGTEGAAIPVLPVPEEVVLPGSAPEGQAAEAVAEGQAKRASPVPVQVRSPASVPPLLFGYYPWCLTSPPSPASFQDDQPEAQQDIAAAVSSGATEPPAADQPAAVATAESHPSASVVTFKLSDLELKDEQAPVASSTPLREQPEGAASEGAQAAPSDDSAAPPAAAKSGKKLRRCVVC